MNQGRDNYLQVFKLSSSFVKTCHSFKNFEQILSLLSISDLSLNSEMQKGFIKYRWSMN